MLTAPEIIQHLEQRIEELKKEYNKYYFEDDSEIRLQIISNITELESLLKKAKGI